MPTIRASLLACALALSAACDSDTTTDSDSDTDGSTGSSAEAPGSGATTTTPARPVGLPATPPPPVASGTAPAPMVLVPAPFQGTFASDAAACDAAGHESLLTIGSATVTFHESTGPIMAVAPVDDGIALTARLTGEGETREATVRYGLSQDGNTLVDLAGGMARVRCPAG